MAESVSTGYKRLFEVRILHHFWLDEGISVFDSLSEEAKIKKLLNYSLNGFLQVKPLPQTASALSGINAIAKQTTLGIVVAVPDNVVIPDDIQLSFTVEITDASFFRYSSLTLQNRKIFECYSPGEDKIYRFKENVPVFSNLTGVPRGTGTGKQLFLSKEIPALTAN